MKKKDLLIILLITLILLQTTACNIPTSDKSIIVPTVSNKNNDIIEVGKNYKILKLSNQSSYHYLIYDNKGNVIYEGTLGIIPEITEIGDGILQEHNGSGNVSQFKFYDTYRGLVSPVYENPAIIENNKIVYMTYEDGKIKLIVRDLFDKSKFYKEYVRDFSKVAAPYNDLIHAKFIDKNKLQITYLSGNDFKEVTEIIELN